MVKITNKQKTISIITIIFLVFLFLVTTTLAVEYASLNEMRERGIVKDASYACGYTNGYDDQSDEKASTPNSIINKYKRVNKDDRDYFCSELAYLYKGSYTAGYKVGYTDADDDKERAVSSDFMNEYDLIKEGSVQTETKTTTYNRWNLDKIDTEQGVENLAYETGYSDASKENSKAPLKIMYDLAKDERREVRDIYEWIRENRGTFIKKYKEGYDAYTVGETEATTKTVHRQSSTLPSQQSGEEQKKAAYDVGYKFGAADAEEGKASNPETVPNYGWILNARYDDTGKYSSKSWYKLPDGVTKTDVEKAVADDASYLKGYRQGYEIAAKEMKGESTEDLTDAEYVYQLGYEVGLEDAEAGEQSNPYTYTWESKRYVSSTEEINYAKLIRYNRGSYIKGYKEGYSSVED